MKKLITIILFFGLSFKAAAQEPLPIFKPGERVCFVGNSITHAGDFHYNILLYYVTRFPAHPVTFYNCGISGDVTSQVLIRLDDDILVRKPTSVVIMIGMNEVARTLYPPRRHSQEIISLG